MSETMTTQELEQQIRDAERELEKAWVEKRRADEEYLRDEYKIWFHKDGIGGWTHQQMPLTPNAWHAVCRAWQKLQELYAQYGRDQIRQGEHWVEIAGVRYGI